MATTNKSRRAEFTDLDHGRGYRYIESCRNAKYYAIQRLLCYKRGSFTGIYVRWLQHLRDVKRIKPAR